MASTSSKPNPSIIFVGLPSHHALVPEAVREKVASGLNQTYKDAAAAGIDMLPCMIPPEDIPRLVSDLQSKRWDGLVIGNGIRSNMELTHFMEQIIAAQAEHAPQARVMFNVGPDTVLDAIRRWFPEVKKL